MKQQYLPAGKIVSTHGLRGDVKILPWADSPEFLLDFDTVYLAGKPYTVEDARVQKTCVLMKLAGVDSVEAAARLRDVVVEIDRDDAELPEGSMFIQDLIGLPVLCEGKTLGKVKEILQLPANDVYVVEGDFIAFWRLPGEEQQIAIRNAGGKTRLWIITNNCHAVCFHVRPSKEMSGI